MRCPQPELKAGVTWYGRLSGAGKATERRDGVLVVTTPDGSKVRQGRDDLDTILSQLLDRSVTIRDSPPAAATIEIVWPNVPGLHDPGSESVEGLAPGGFFDLAPPHLVTTATLRRLRELTPTSDFDARRFRPNVVVETVPSLNGFVEAGWVGRTVVVGDTPLSVTAPCSRCVMTTLAQPGLRANQQVLRAAVAHNAAAVGVYATTDVNGEVAASMPVWVA